MRVLAIVNDRAGGGETALYDFLRFLGLGGNEVVLRFVSNDRPLESLLTDAREFDRIVAVGGDGTVSSVCYATRGSKVPVLAYPAGTANLLALNLGMPTDPPALSDVLLNGVPVAVDLGELEHHGPNGSDERTGFAIIAGAGYDATIMQSAEPLKPALGPAAYLVAAVGNLAPTSARFELNIDGRKISTDGIAILIVNFGRLQFDLPVTPNTDPRDGIFEVAVVRTRNALGLIPAVAAAMLDRVREHPDRSPGIDLYSGSRIEVSAYPQLRMQSDGDAIDALTPFAAQVLPGAATLMVPADSPLAR